MNKKILIGSIIAVALIVLSSFSSVVGKVSSDEKLVEFDVEFCGLGKKHIVKLTQQEADEVELLFDDIEQRLSEVESREEAEVIFKDAVVELDKYRLLGGLSIEQVQNLVTGRKQNQKASRFVESLKERQSHFNDNEFYETYLLCLMAGHSNRTFFLGPITTSLFLIGFLLTLFNEIWPGIIPDKFWERVEPIANFMMSLTIFNMLYNPLPFANIMMMGLYVVWMSHGWIFTAGINGINSRNDYFYGFTWFFTGLKIHIGEFDFLYLGFAPAVQLNPIFPE